MSSKQYYRRNRKRIIAQNVAYARKRRGHYAHERQLDPMEERLRVAGVEVAGIEPAATIEEIAKELGITKARVGQIIQSALRKMRRAHPEARELLTGERVAARVTAP